MELKNAIPGKSEPMESNHIHAGYKTVALPMSYVPQMVLETYTGATDLRNWTARSSCTNWDTSCLQYRVWLENHSHLPVYKYWPLYFHHTMSFSVDYRNYHHIQLSKMTQVFQCFSIAICKHPLWITAVIRIELISLAWQTSALNCLTGYHCAIQPNI